MANTVDLAIELQKLQTAINVAYIAAAANIIAALLGIGATIWNSRQTRQQNDKLAKDAASLQREIAEKQAIVTATINEYNAKEQLKSLKLTKELDFCEKRFDAISKLKRELKPIPNVPLRISGDDDKTNFSSGDNKTEPAFSEAIEHLFVIVNLHKQFFDENLYRSFHERHRLLRNAFTNFKALFSTNGTIRVKMFQATMDGYFEFISYYFSCEQIIDLQLELLKQCLNGEDETTIAVAKAEQLTSKQLESVTN